MSLREFPYVTGLYRLFWHTEEPMELLVRWQTAGLLPGRSVLEVGCGGGTDALWLASRGYAVTAVDWSANAVRIVGEKSRARGLPITPLQVDVTQPGALPGRFDLVFDRYCLQDLLPAGKRAYALNLRDWLAPGGSFVVAAWVRPGGGMPPPHPHMIEGTMEELFPELILEEKVVEPRRRFQLGSGARTVFRFRSPGAPPPGQAATGQGA
jgi:SAM-dependent methyltransferase